MHYHITLGQLTKCRDCGTLFERNKKYSGLRCPTCHKKLARKYYEDWRDSGREKTRSNKRYAWQVENRICVRCCKPLPEGCAKIYCPTCQKKARDSYLLRKDKIKPIRAAYNLKFRRKILDQQKRHNRDIRYEAIRKVGHSPEPICARCSCDIIDLLEIHHINNDGNIRRRGEWRERSTTFYRAIILGTIPIDHLGVLCHLCNHLAYIEFKYGKEIADQFRVIFNNILSCNNSWNNPNRSSGSSMSSLQSSRVHRVQVW